MKVLLPQSFAPTDRSLGRTGFVKPASLVFDRKRRPGLAGFHWLPLALVLAAAIPGSGTAAAHETAKEHLAPTPPMGWMSWNAFGHPHRDHEPSINEEVVKEIADRMVESGMRDAGYEYLVIDGGWRATSRDANGEMRADPEFFPSGMKALGEYIHSRGLKFGLHQAVDETDCGNITPGTGSAPGRTYPEKARFDANTFAGWGVDYLKFDWCGEPEGRGEGTSLKEWQIAIFTSMREALDATGRDIVLSINCPQEAKMGEWAPEAGIELWRTTQDVHPCWISRKASGFPRGVLDAIEFNSLWAENAGSGYWNDPDMLVLGETREQTPACTGGLTDVEGRAQFSLYAMMAAPLMVGSDLRKDSRFTLETLTNPEVIAVNQDSLGVQGGPIERGGDREVWVKPLADGDRAIVLFNKGEESATIATNAKEVGFEPAETGYVVRDLWAREDSVTEGEISAEVPAHGVAMFRVRPAPPAGP